MNGRVYDPVLGRFLSADPTVDGVYDSQGYNRYSYGGNNPMNATDPSGYFSLKDVLPAIIAIVVTAVVIVAIVASGGTAITGLSSFFSALQTGLGTTAAIWGGAAGGFAGGFSGSLLNGGSIGDAFKAGVIGAAVGAATAWASGQIGGFFGADNGTFSQWGGRTLAHATVGGLASEAQGGSFRHGFYSSAASAGIMHAKGVSSFMGGSKGGAWIAARTAAAAVIGGTASVLSGGKFANGAVTSAFQHLFNSEAAKAHRNFEASGSSEERQRIWKAMGQIRFGKNPYNGLSLKALEDLEAVERTGIPVKIQFKANFGHAGLTEYQLENDRIIAVTITLALERTDVAVSLAHEMWHAKIALYHGVAASHAAATGVYHMYAVAREYEVAKAWNYGHRGLDDRGNKIPDDILYNDLIR